ncbi:LLM class flavin-dependent oxidoreductase [Mycolicibacterium sp. S2-37]|uniref:LLM class flavin-dependent oxidoreductase n=1 Tax=Mycolicibacterium sp. S2-37 TaxID=2810297 RepID=UPI001A951EA6|nr:LLM class flavin-dependent oxidoreductase [Mycolicibacterium sp. S2-37]MBO0676612.1 LLM class flavin-dependent oxidoreductase [Mycolicibacterium sp. S2-37]
MTDFGVLLFPNVGWDTLVDRCEQAEQLGFRSLWIDDHAVNPAAPRSNWLDAFSTLAGLANCTRRILLGPLVANPVLRQPVMLARQASSLEAMSGGRLQLGLGAGYAPTDHAAVGEPVWDLAERAGRFAEAVEVIDRLLRGESVDHAGRYYRVDGMRIRPRPHQLPRPPLCIAAHRRESLKVVARHGDIWSSFGGWGLSSSQLLSVTRSRSAVLDDFCAELGRDRRTIRRQILAGSPATTPDPIWSSVGAFDDWVAGWREIGIDEIVLYFPPEVLYERELIDPAVLEHLRALLFARRGAGRHG